MSFFKKTWLLLAVVSSSTSSLKSVTFFNTDIDLENIDAQKAALCTAGLVAAGAVTYGSYRLIAWAMEPKNRVYRALENGKSQTLEIWAFLAES